MGELSKETAYRAMQLFLEAHYDRTRADDIGALLSAMQMLDDGAPADPAMWSDWERAVKESLAELT